MAVITITIPAVDEPRVFDGFAAQHKRPDVVPNTTFDPEVDAPSLATIPNPQTKEQFLKEKIVEFVKGSVRAEETRLALETARGVMPSEPDIT